MERLTEKHIECMNDFCHKTECELYSACPSLERYNRLAAYENTGMEPEEVKRCKLTLMGKSLAEITEFDGISIERLKELAIAEKAGRLVVLPCKVGTKVYSTRWWNEVPETCTDSKGRKFQRMAIKHKVTKEEFSPFGLDYIQFGEKVFLTREEAERALEGGNGDAG